MGHRNHVETFDTGEVSWVAGEDRDAFGEGRRRDHRIERPSLRLAPRATEIGGYPTELPGRGGIEGERTEVCFRQLEMCLPSGAFPVVAGDQGPDRQLGQGHGADEWLVRE